MEISGSHKIKAAREQVFQALLDPAVLKNCVPGCDEAVAIDSATERVIKLVVSPAIPGFKGPYTIYMKISEIEPPTHVVLTAEPTSSIGSVKAVCETTLLEEAEHTLLNYHANADIQGKIGAVPDFVLKGALKGAMDHFFKNLEKQLRTLAA